MSEIEKLQQKYDSLTAEYDLTKEEHTKLQNHLHENLQTWMTFRRRMDELDKEKQELDRQKRILHVESDFSYIKAKEYGDKARPLGAKANDIFYQRERVYEKLEKLKSRS